MVTTILDIETTGYLSFDSKDGVSVLSDNSEILEVGYINIIPETRDILNYGTLYFYKPYFKIESPAQEVHKLTRDFLKQYEDKFEMNLIALNSLIQSSCLITKNGNKFDIPFIKAFIDKHAGHAFDIQALVEFQEMKAYNGGKVHYVNSMYSIDMEAVFKDRWRDLFYDMNKYYPPKRKKGTLSDYVDAIPSGRDAVNYVYDSLKKDRVTGAHGALYDCVMTYVVWCDARNNNLC